MISDPDATTSTAVMDSLVQLSFAVQEVLARAAADHDVSMTQLRLLGILRDRRPAMAAIADHLGLDRSSITGLVDRAERRGLVARTTSTRDARVTIVSATPGGLAVAGQIEAAVTTGIEALVAPVPDEERACLVRAAGAMVHAPGPAVADRDLG